MRITWESIDDFRPPNRKHIPKSEYPALDRAIAQKNNNALSLLRWRLQPASSAQETIRNHDLTRESQFHALKSTILISTLAPFRLSKLENLPWSIMQEVYSWLPYSDYICFSLASKTLMRYGEDYHRTIYALIVMGTGLWGFDEEFTIGDHLELMYRLEVWMPAHYKFCHHCLKYVPRLAFGFADGKEDAIVCMDCRRHAQKERIITRSESAGCWGCMVKGNALEGLIELRVESDDIHAEWEGTVLEKLEQWRPPLPTDFEAREEPLLPRLMAQLRRRREVDESDMSD